MTVASVFIVYLAIKLIAYFDCLSRVFVNKKALYASHTGLFEREARLLFSYLPAGVNVPLNTP